MSSKQQLKPLTHKKLTNNIEPIGKVPLTKEISKADNSKILKQ